MARQQKASLTIRDPTGNVSFSIKGLPIYSINVTCENATASASNPTTIVSGRTATLTFTANTGYELPDTVTVSGATPNWTKSTGTLILSNPTSNVSVEVIAEEPVIGLYIYYGGAGSENEQEDPSEADLAHMTKESVTTATIVGTRAYRWVTATEDDGRYASFVLPTGYKVTAWKDSTGTFSYPVTQMAITNGTIFYYNSIVSDYPKGIGYLITVSEA